ncbi:uncharacterized protein BT62DRAFT_905098, partial [Guyanagaster necrorhizus]
LLHDEAVNSPETETFNPERFMKDGVLNLDVPFPMETFGFSQCICPGKDMAIDSIKIMMASLLAMFDFDNAVNASLSFWRNFSNHFNSYPALFKCSIQPGSQAAASLIRADT